MSKVLDAIRHHSRSRHPSPALLAGGLSLSYAWLAGEIRHMAGSISQQGIRCLALALDNSPGWIAADLGAVAVSVPTLPVPAFFSPAQVAHALADAGADALLTDEPARLEGVLEAARIPYRATRTSRIADRTLHWLALGLPRRTLPPGTAKITYTSGTTGSPKGVCLSQSTLELVARSLATSVGLRRSDRHAALLPLATLLENVAGIYAPLFAGATVLLPGSAETGLSGSSQTDAGRLLDTLARSAASTTILLPEMLKTLVGALEAGGKRPDRLRFAAVGGATVAPRLLAEATERGLPVFEGYGLSECGSVVTLNVPAQHRPGSVGRPLPHVRLNVDEAGEIRVGGAVMLGYAGEGGTPRPWPTGDLGHIDADGFLHITGRKRNAFITSFGRNVSPEWVEARLTASPLIAQAAVFGEGRPWNTAVLVSPAADAFEGRALIDRHIATVNADLPDYARVSAWIEADAPFTPENDQLTPNGRLRRDAIWRAYRGAITWIYGDKQRALSR